MASCHNHLSKLPLYNRLMYTSHAVMNKTQNPLVYIKQTCTITPCTQVYEHIRFTTVPGYVHSITTFAMHEL